MTDLASSIRDGRHREQKFRLKTQMQICKVLYLYEGIATDCKYQKVSKKTLISAINNTFIRDGFFVKETKDINQTVDFILQMHIKINDLGQKNLLNKNEVNKVEYIDFVIVK